jgi:hypothetical protein
MICSCAFPIFAKRYALTNSDHKDHRRTHFTELENDLNLQLPTTRLADYTHLMVELRCGAVAVGSTYLFPPLSAGGALVARP